MGKAKTNKPTFRITLLLWILLASMPKVEAQQSKRPNIVVVLADDMRWDYLGAMGAN